MNARFLLVVLAVVWGCSLHACVDWWPFSSAMLTVGLQVWGFETLTSEQLREQEEGKGGVLYRKRGRVFPEVGCALDNLSL